MSDLTTSDGFKSSVVHALQLAKKELDAKKTKANFVRIIMRFPQIKAVFDKLRAVHAKCDVSGDGRIDVKELTEAMTELFNQGRADGREPIEKEVVARTLSLSEVDSEDGLDVKEFITMCAIGFILAEENKDISTMGGMLASGDDDYRHAMTDVVTAYLSFDRDAKGYFTAEEFNGFMTASKRADAAKSFLTDDRWAELDVSGDGKVEFEEFVYAFSQWVSVDDDEDEDEEADGEVNRSSNPLNQRVLLALKLTKEIMEKKGKGVNFTRIIMRFPKIHKVFDRIRVIHAKTANDSGHIELPQLRSALTEIMNGSSSEEADSIDMEQVENLFMLSDFDQDGVEGLNVKEFIVFCAVGFILAEAGGRTAKTLNGMVSLNDKEYRDAMNDIVSAYLTFDKEGKGYFTVDEMHCAVASNTKKDAASLLTPERWSELDQDHSGRVDFEEFVYAFSNWVTTGDDEDDDDE